MALFALPAAPQAPAGADAAEAMQRASQFYRDKRYEPALDAFLLAARLTEQARTDEERRAYVTASAMAAACNQALERHEAAYRLAAKLVKMQLPADDEKSIHHLFAYNGYLTVLRLIKKDKLTLAEYEEGRALLEEIAPYADESLKKHILPKVPYLHYKEGATHFLNADLEAALTCFERAGKGYLALADTANAVIALNYAATSKNFLYDAYGAATTYSQALELARRINKPARQMSLLKDLKKLHEAFGNVERAAAYAAAIDSLVQTTADEPTLFEYYLQKGNEERRLAHFEAAEQWLLKGRSMAERPGAESQRRKALVYLALRELYTNAERYDEALAYGFKQIDALKRLSPADEGHYKKEYPVLAAIYRQQGNKAACFALFDSLFADPLPPEGSRELANLYKARALSHLAFKDYAEALAGFKQADTCLARNFPPNHGERITLQALMGGAVHHLGRYDEAAGCYERYADGIKALYGEQSLDYINAQIYLANAQGFAGRLKAGCDNYTAAANRLKALVASRLPYLTTAEREHLWQPLSSLFTDMTPYALKANHRQSDFTESCYDALVLSKAFLLETEQSLYAAVKKAGNEADMRSYMAVALMKASIKAMENDYRKNADSLLSLTQRVERAESRLLSRCSEYADVAASMNIDYKTVKKALKGNEVLIDFTDFVSQTAGRRYAAYVINGRQSHPLLLPLFEERKIDSLGITRPDMFFDALYAPEVLKLIWEPLKAHVPEGGTVYYVPSQLLFQISLESLPLADGSLLGHHYNFVRLSSARSLVKAAAAPARGGAQTAVLYGGLDYDAPAPEALPAATAASALRAAHGAEGFDELPGSKKEVAEIAAALKKGRWHVTTLTGAAGTEASFNRLSGRSPRLLHFSTHGFYYSPQRAAEVDFLKGHKDAMRLSGMVLSGGNAAWRGKTLPDGLPGGVLTADKIARTDLSQTDLVVLSACKSGVGKATAEGLYGLQRAFKKAGAGTIVMTLWNVSDRETEAFMTLFYKRLTDKANRGNKRKAFEQAKAEMRKKHPDPFHWAAFVMLD